LSKAPQASATHRGAGTASKGSQRERLEVVLIGGTDRNAGHAVAVAIDRFDGFGTGPVEAGFHAESGGLPDLLEGKASLVGFGSRVRNRWWRRDGGLGAIASEEQLEAALERLRSDYVDDPLPAARRFFLDLMSPPVTRRRGRRIVDWSGDNLRYAQILHQLLPEARFVSAIRDGREAALHLAAQGRVDDPVAGLLPWLERVRELDVGVHGNEDGGAYALPADRLHVIVLGRVESPEATDEASAALRSLRTFVQADGETAADTPLSTDSTLGALESPELSKADRRRLRRQYERALKTLRGEGVHAAAALSAAYERR
jgi:hypothetical protein